MRQWSIIGMTLAQIRELTPEQFRDAPLTQAEFEYLVAMVNAGQIYPGEPTSDVVHFRLNSGMHCVSYINNSLVLAETNLCSILSQQLIQTCEVKIGDVDWVAASAYAAMPLGSEVARQLRCRFGYVEKGSGRALEGFRFTIPEGERVFVVNELMTTGGGSTFQTKEVVRTLNANRVQFLPFVGVMVHRSKDEALVDGTLVRPVFRFGSFPTYDPPNCPFCAAGSPLVGGKRDWKGIKLYRAAVA